MNKTQAGTHAMLILLWCILHWGCSKSDEVTEQNITIVGQQKPPVPPNPNTRISVQLNHMVGNLPLKFNEPYLNQWGETFTVNTFKYYLSNWVLVYDTALVKVENSYFLVDHENAKSQTIAFTNIPTGKLVGIQMLIGVDAERNQSGAQTGALDPSLGMFWTWNSGYIMAKLEGTYVKATNPKALFIWHCGGFEPPYSGIRTIQLQLPQTTIDTVEQTIIELNGDMLEWFDKPYPLRIDSVPVFNDPTPISARLADNYSDMFTVKTVRKAPFR